MVLQLWMQFTAIKVSIFLKDEENVEHMHHAFTNALLPISSIKKCEIIVNLAYHTHHIKVELFRNNHIKVSKYKGITATFTRVLQ